MIEGLIRPIWVYLHQLCFAIALVMKHQKTLAKVRRLLTDRIPAYIPHRTQYSIYGRHIPLLFVLLRGPSPFAPKNIPPKSTPPRL